MKVIDISWPISDDMTNYRDQRVVEFKQERTLEKDGMRQSTFTLGSHTGTHVDAPAHFLARGETIEKVPLERLVGNCYVLDFTHLDEKITRDDLDIFDLDEEDIVLLKTKNSLLKTNEPFNPNFVYLEESGAQYLAESGIKSVGIDYLGIERNQPNHPTHAILLQADIPIIEGLRLAHVDEGQYSIICLPLAVQGLEAAPVRAILLDDGEEEG